MPEIGAKQTILSLADALKDVRAAADEAKSGVASALVEMAQDIRAQGVLAVKKVKSEHEATIAAFGDILGNERAGDDQKGS